MRDEFKQNDVMLLPSSSQQESIFLMHGSKGEGWNEDPILMALDVGFESCCCFFCIWDPVKMHPLPPHFSLGEVSWAGLGGNPGLGPSISVLGLLVLA